MSDLNTAITNTDFRDEFSNIADYMVSAFSGETESRIRQAMEEVLDTMLSELRHHQYVMISGNGIINEVSCLGNAIRNAEKDIKADLLVAYTDIICFQPDEAKALNLTNQSELWERTRKDVRNIISKALPNLYPVGLNELLEDEEATIDPQPNFNGLLIQTVGSFPFRKKVSPPSLRYDQQEQGNHWLNVVAGAIACHYLTFIEIKQDQFLKQALSELVKLTDNDLTKLLTMDIKQFMITTYKDASLLYA